MRFYVSIFSFLQGILMLACIHSMAYAAPARPPGQSQRLTDPYQLLVGDLTHLGVPHDQIQSHSSNLRDLIGVLLPLSGDTRLRLRLIPSQPELDLTYDYYHRLFHNTMRLLQHGDPVPTIENWSAAFPNTPITSRFGNTQRGGNHRNNLIRGWVDFLIQERKPAMELMKNSFYNALNQAMLQVKHTNLPNPYENPYYQDVRNAERLGRHQQLQQQPPPTIHRAGTSGGIYENPFYADVAHAERTAAGQLSRFPIVNPSHPGMALSQGHQQTPIHHSGPSLLSQTIQPGNSLGLSLHPVGQTGGSQRHHATPPRGPHS